MRHVRTSIDSREARRDRRYPLPTLFLTIADIEHASANWSLGGFMIQDFQGPIAVGAVLHGTMRFDGSPRALFRAEVVRVGPGEGEFGARFRELDDDAFDLLDRAISRKLFRPRDGG
jgi:hypothetical protein